jgi:hypothetical protein
MIIDVKLNQKTFNKIQNAPDKIVYSVASNTLHRSYNTIPLSNRKNNGHLRESSMDYGVKGSNAVYKIGSQTGYAKYVWVMNNETTHWTTTGTGSKWYINYLKKHGKQLIAESIKENL